MGSEQSTSSSNNNDNNNNDDDDDDDNDNDNDNSGSTYLAHALLRLATLPQRDMQRGLHLLQRVDRLPHLLSASM